MIDENSSLTEARSDLKVTVMFSRKSGREYPVFYGPDYHVMRDVTYAVNSLFPDGVPLDNTSNERNCIYELRRFLSYLIDNDTPLERCDDKVLKMYRGVRLVETMTSKKGKQNEYKCKRSVNAYLKYIYQFIAQYYEDNRAILPNFIGCTDEYRIKSGLFDRDGTRLHGKDKNRKVRFCPLQFKMAKSSSSLNPQDIPTDADYYELLECIDKQAGSAFVRNRDKLIVNIARNSGFRRISINSLNASDFTDSVIDFAELNGCAPITPKKQKFSYNKSFDVDYSLLLQIKSYIDNTLIPHLEDQTLYSGWDGALFVNSKNGSRMTKRYMTQCISKYCRILGWSQGKSIHVFRHLFASSEFEAEYEYQLNLGDKDPNRAMRAAKVALSNKMGHLSTTSQEAYLVATRLRESGELQHKKHEAEKVEIAYRAKQQQALQKAEANLALLKKNRNLDIDFFD